MRKFDVIFQTIFVYSLGISMEGACEDLMILNRRRTENVNIWEIANRYTTEYNILNFNIVEQDLSLWHSFIIVDFLLWRSRLCSMEEHIGLLGDNS